MWYTQLQHAFMACMMLTSMMPRSPLETEIGEIHRSTDGTELSMLTCWAYECLFSGGGKVNPGGMVD
jgi:hypothetical protein